jgi:ABC-type cobalamin transport system permease subunit
VVTGIWPLISIRTFELVTGPKVEKWLVKTVGILVAVVGVVLSAAAWRRTVDAEVALLGVGSAAGLAAIDIVYSSKGRISKVYLLDALVEALLIAAWTFEGRASK